MQLNELNTKVEKKVEEFKSNFDLVNFEKQLKNVIEEFQKGVIQEAIECVLKDKEFIKQICVLAGLMDLTYEGKRPVTITVLNGQKITVKSPYFYKRIKKNKQGRPKDGRKKGNYLECHLGLSYMGFIQTYSMNIVDEICKMAILCPSIEMARKLLEDSGVLIDEKTIRRIVRDVGIIGLSNRGYVSVDASELTEDKTLVIGIDGGRLRERKKKRGKKKEGQKRQGYTTDWKEPKLFTIYLADDKGKAIKEIDPFYDATMYGKEAIFEILETYLRAINIEGVKRIVFCGDGAPWIWIRIERLIAEHLKDFTVYQVLDYTHAVQGLGEIFELLPQKNKQYNKLWNEAKRLLWEGETDQLKELIINSFSGRKKLKAALKKWGNYFDLNRNRMTYSIFKQEGIPCGSGSVESAIRRVINLRLKSAGSFWTKEMAEIFLFLRSQLISGRWNIFWKNLRERISMKNCVNKGLEIKTNYRYDNAA